MSVFWRPRGCVLWFDFATLSGGTAYDLSGQGNNGVIYGAKWERGHLTGALSFDGVDDYVEVPHSDVLNIATGNKITIEILAKLEGWQEGFPVGVPIDKRTPLEANYNWEFDGATISMRIHAGGKVFAVAIPHSLGIWNHYIMTLDGKVLSGFLNGELKAQRTDVPISATNTRNLHIGQAIWYNYRTEGKIALVRIYNRALTEREIKAHYHYLTKPMARVPA